MKNYPNFEKLAHVIQHGLQGFIVKNMEGKATEANDLSHVLQKWVCCKNKNDHSSSRDIIVDQHRNGCVV